MKPEHQPGLPARLNYRGFVAPGVLALADGAFLTAWEYYGPDQEYADYISMEALAEQLHSDLAKLGSGWMVQAEAIRVPITLPPATNHCPEPTSQLVFEERANEYATTGTHFETRLVLTLTWLPPSDVTRKFSQYFFGERRHGAKQSRLVLLSIFQAQAKQLTDALGHFLKLRPMSDDELAHFLRYCVTGEDRKIGVESEQLHYSIGATEMEPYRGRIGDKHFRVVGVYGFPRGTSAQMLDDLLRLPFALRVSQRFIFLGTQKAIKELEIKKNKWGAYNWWNWKRIAERANKNVTGNEAGDDEVSRNDDVVEQMRSVKREITKLQEGAERGGYYTLSVIVMDGNEEQVEQQAAHIVLLLNRKGFSAVIEADNAPYALRGSWPGHGTENVRQPRLTARHYTNLMPLSSPWRGSETHPSPLYPKGSGPLLICKSSGSTPFHFSPALHFFVIGPTGAGKSVLFNAMATAHLQYDRGQVFTFDLGASALVSTLACGGEYFDLHGMRFSPLAHIDQEEEQSWALDFLEQCAKLRDFPMTPLARVDLQRALTDLSTAPIGHRTMTGLLAQLQTSEAGLRAALNYYAGNNPGAMLDGHYTPVTESHWLTFDIEQLRKYSQAVRSSALTTQIHALQRRMDGRPTLMLFEEGWIAGEEEILKLLIEEESATARKKVVSIGLVLHSPGDLSIFPHADRLRANVMAKIFLPNPEADTAGMRQHYLDMGLGRREIRLLTEMRPRSEYFMVEGTQRRRFQLPWGPWQAALLGTNGRDHKAHILELRKTFGDTWLPVWLRQQQQQALAEQWEYRALRKDAA